MYAKGFEEQSGAVWRGIGEGVGVKRSKVERLIWEKDDCSVMVSRM